MINVTRSFMPPIEEYEEYLKQIWNTRYLTNEGPILQELVSKMKEYLGLNNVNMVTNGTIALELAIKALDIKEGEIITTPFTFVATTSSILCENCTPVFVDIDPETLCIDADKIEEKITKNTKAIMAVHVFGYPCDVEKIENIANKHNLKVIYDGAHCFGSKYNGKSLLGYGDITTCSFHATKLFHTIEGGACFSKDDEINNKINSLKKFGEANKEYQYIGTNAKMSEFNAAMGLANLKYIEKIIKERKKICDLYDKLLYRVVKRPSVRSNTEQNYIYYPIILRNEQEVIRVIKKLNSEGINPRRYFYPSLNTLKFVKQEGMCPISEEISKKILCLPLYNGLTENDIKKICKIIKDTVKE